MDPTRFWSPGMAFKPSDSITWSAETASSALTFSFASAFVSRSGKVPNLAALHPISQPDRHCFHFSKWWHNSQMPYFSCKLVKKQDSNVNLLKLSPEFKLKSEFFCHSQHWMPSNTPTNLAYQYYTWCLYWSPRNSTSINLIHRFLYQ